MFNDLNAAARESYGAARALALKSDQPVFLVTHTVTLIRGEDLGSLPYSPPLYHELKSISHLPLGVHSASIGLLESPTKQPWIERLRTLVKNVDIAEADLAKASFTEAQRVRQQKILSLSRAYIDNVLSRENVDMASITRYSRALAPLLLANAADAANVQIEALDQAVRELSKKLKPGEFEKALAVITGPKTPREGNLQFQYFVYAFGPGSAGSRVLYMESIFDREAALGVLRTVLNDRVASQAFFGDTYRLERDLMADGATVELMRRFGHLGQ
ncbi:hypothetical protein [Zwartia hollandica]|uniref:hypothetical protein n=1 Tax=Zwartia hollandica TaxID=324606 RepID=UPI002180C547|nr:hypothetical protein [Zwartia hollandica]